MSISTSIFPLHAAWQVLSFCVIFLSRNYFVASTTVISSDRDWHSVAVKLRLIKEKKFEMQTKNYGNLIKDLGNASPNISDHTNISTADRFSATIIVIKHHFYFRSPFLAPRQCLYASFHAPCGVWVNKPLGIWDAYETERRRMFAA